MTASTSAEHEFGPSSDKVLKALAWQPKKKTSQAAFDQSVLDNIEALDMSPEEAVQSAIEEYQIQGVDLTDIIQTPEGADISRHPMKLALDALLAALDQGVQGAALQDAVTGVQEKLAVAEGAARLQNLAVAHHAHALRELLLRSVKPDVAQPVLLQLLRTCVLLLQSTAVRDSFAEKSILNGVEFNGPHIAATLLETHSRENDIVVEIGNMCGVAATGCEEGKCKLMECKFPSAAIAAINEPTTALAPTAALCSALKSLMTHDDDRPPTSKAFVHSRVLATDQKAVPALLQAFRRSKSEPVMLGQVVASLQQLCANDDICKQVLDADGVALAIDTLKANFTDDTVVAATCGLLRQLAKSDAVKVLLVELGQLETIVEILDAHKRSVRVMVQVLGLLATIMLRHPEHCEAVFAQPGCIDHVLDAMREHRGNPAVNRQACQALRNLVARNKELGAPVLAKGAEALLRSAKALTDCDDVAVGAMRDLGVENYNA